MCVCACVRACVRVRVHSRAMILFGCTDRGSWHEKYKDSAYVFVKNLDYELTEGDIICIFSQLRLPSILFQFHSRSHGYVCVCIYIYIYIYIYMCVCVCVCMCVCARVDRFGEIVDCHLPRDRDSKKSRGFCFLAYEDQRSSVLAVDNMNGSKVSLEFERMHAFCLFFPSFYPLVRFVFAVFF